MKRRIAVFVVLGMLPWAGLNAQQRGASTTFRVTAKVEAGCEMTASDPASGAYAAQRGTALQGTPLLLRATCTPNSTYRIGLDEGTSPGAAVNRQSVAAGSPILDDQVTGTGTGLAVDHALFGPVPAAQVLSAGDTAGTVTVRIYY